MIWLEIEKLYLEGFEDYLYYVKGCMEKGKV